MPDTVQVEDNFNGTSGTAMPSHTPDTIASGGASYSTADYQLNGSGGARLTTLSYGATPSIFLDLTGVHVIAGVYFEVDFIWGQYAGSGSAPPSWSITFNSSELAQPFFGVNRAAGTLSLGSHDTTIPFAYPGTASLRVEIDQYAKTTKYYINGSLIWTDDDTAWYTGSETWADDSFPLRVTAYNEPGFSVVGGTIQNIVDRVEVGTLGLGGGSSPSQFWERRLRAREEL